MTPFNPEVALENLFFSRKKIAMEAHYLHKSHSHHIKNVVKEIKQIGFTLDVWTSPNTIAFLGIMAHAITNSWDLIDVVIEMPQVHSSHTGYNFSKVLFEFLNSYNLTNFLVSITANNTSYNSTLAARVEQILDSEEAEDNSPVGETPGKS
ncbi:uncharacterized protein VP01_2295g1 [Puccinia sorghi]|uniref:HAT C-terminal dimerisation domain-containing protein n=1 Tax=Puccinia sorghi TaxID=27349 RepID=A0A0L6V8P6_9BASI|nr:uncharacterized protein VP01_2295g1 [Puccinia sorghi]